MRLQHDTPIPGSRRLRGILLVACALGILVTLSPSAANAESYTCGFLDRGTAEVEPDPNDFYEVAAAVFEEVDPIFNDHFTIYTEWDPSTNAPWGNGDLIDYAEYIIEPGNGCNGLAQRILDYFGEDTDPDPNHFSITDNGTTYARFKIYMYVLPRKIHAYDDWLTATVTDDNGQPLTAWEAVRDAFAHEWQHSCHQSWTQPDTAVNEFFSFDEMCSVFSAERFGLDDPGSLTPYETPIAGRRESAFRYRCMNAVSVDSDQAFPQGSPCTTLWGNAYNDWAMFAIYLNNSYTYPPGGGMPPFEEFMYRWIRQYSEDGTGFRTYHHDFVGLGETLDHPDLDPLFSPGASQAERVKEVFRSYALAKYVNAQTLAFPLVPKYQWSRPGVYSGGYRPQDLYNFQQDANGACYDNVLTFAPYYECTEARQELSGWQYSADFYGYCDVWDYDYYLPEWVRRRMVQVETYASNYIVLLPPAGGGQEASFSLRFLDTYECMLCASGEEYPYYIEDQSSQYSGQVELAVDFVSYDIPEPHPPIAPGAGGLDIYGEDVIDVETHWISPSPGAVVDFPLGGFGNGVDAIAVVLSLVPSETPSGLVDGVTLPYEFRFQSLPEQPNFWTGNITDSQTMEANGSYWILGDLNVLAGGSLEIEEGAVVYFCGEDARISVQGGSLTISGSADSPVELGSSNLPDYPNDTYEGLFASQGGTITAHDCHIHGALEITANTATVGFKETELFMPDDDGNAVVLLDLQNTLSHPVLEDCVFHDVNRIRIGSAENRTAKITGCAIYQRSEFQTPMSLPPPLLYSIEGNLVVEESLLRFLRTGVQVGEKYMLGTPVALLGPGLELAPLVSGAENATAVTGRGPAEVVLNGCEIRGAAVGVKAWASSEVSLSKTQILQGDYGVVSYAFGGQVEIVGDDPGTPGIDESNFIAPSETTADCWDKPVLSPCVVAPDNVTMVRVYNATSSVIPAARNMWGTCDESEPEFGINCMCAGAFFLPDAQRVAYVPWTEQGLQACSGPGSPLFSTLAEHGSPDEEGAWPNPFNGTLSVRYAAQGADCTLEVFDILGRRVRAIAGSLFSNGDREFVWDGATEDGRPASSGVYFYRISGGSHPMKGKVVYVK